MTWVKIDDSAPQHPKMLGLGADAFALWVSALCYSNRLHTDGRIPFKAPESIVSTIGMTRARCKRAVSVLLSAGLFEEDDESFIIHDYADYQSEALRSAVTTRRDAEKKRKRAYRDSKSNNNQEMSQRDTSSASGNVPAAGDALSQDPGPARPGPTRPDQGETSSSTCVDLRLVPPEGEPTTKASKTPRSDPRADEVFAHWRDTLLTPEGAKRAVFDPKRRAKVTALLRSYSVARLKLAIDGVKKSDWHMSQSPPVVELVTVLRDGAQVERFESLAIGDAGAGNALPDYLRVRKNDEFEHDDPVEYWAKMAAKDAAEKAGGL